MYNISKRKNIHNISAEKLIALLQEGIKNNDFSKDAKIIVCGDNLAYLHVESDGSTINFDTEDLEECYLT